MTFGEKLKEARKNAGLSQEEFAAQLSVSRSAVAKWETNKGVPDVENLKAMAKLLDVSIDYLLEEGGNLDLTVTKEPISFFEETIFERGICRLANDHALFFFGYLVLTLLTFPLKYIVL